jgi:hypothetical protein
MVTVASMVTVPAWRQQQKPRIVRLKECQLSRTDGDATAWDGACGAAGLSRWCRYLQAAADTAPGRISNNKGSGASRQLGKGERIASSADSCDSGFT